jgi:hypothetical protein
MPAYNTATAPVLTPSRPVKVWDAEAVTTGGKSQQISMHRFDQPGCLSVEVKFSGAPGAFTLDLQTADTDAEAYYVTKTSLTAVNSTNVGRLEVPTVVAKFARLVMTGIANTVNTTATFC